MLRVITEENIDNYSPTNRLARLYNDANNYRMISLCPSSEWFVKRIQWIRTYAALDWLGLGEHLNRRSTMLGNLCTTIYRQLQAFVATFPSSDSLPSSNTLPSSDSLPSPTFSISSFCAILAKIDYVWHILLPVHLEGIESPSVLALLEEFGQRPSSP
jgi:hypothetical protein